MFLDVPFAFNGIKYATLTVAKSKEAKRPAFISFILPNNVIFERGLQICFTNDFKNGSRFMTTDVSFSEKSTDTYIARVANGYAASGNKADIFDGFITYKYIMLLFYGKGDKQKDIIIPLWTFQSQYSQLP